MWSSPHFSAGITVDCRPSGVSTPKVSLKDGITCVH